MHENNIAQKVLCSELWKIAKTYELCAVKLFAPKTATVIMEDINHFLAEARAGMEKAIEHLNHELIKLRTGKASTAMLQDILVEYYGAPTPLSQVANVQISDARTIVIQPWERNLLGPIERVLINSNLGITPANDGEIIRLMVPPLTEERRKELVKKAKHAGEESKVGVRNMRHKALDQIKKAVKDGVPEDLGKRKETELQDMVNKHIEQIDKILATKEKEIMTV
jgi:ribosome recycling factor